MKCAFLTVGLCLLAGCAPPPYEGMNVQSYGPLVRYQQSQTFIPQNIPSCDAEAQDQLAAFLAQKITGKIAEQVGGLVKIDPGILHEELQDNFEVLGDFTHYSVVILDRSPDHISFWHESDLVPLAEVTKAAGVFCGHQHRKAFYQGSARRCSGPQQMPVVINGQSTMQETYAISAFSCGTRVR